MSIARPYALDPMRTSYLIALGSNCRHPRFGAPAKVIEAAIAALAMPLVARARITVSAPVGPSLRTYANTAIWIETERDPLALLAHLKTIEARFGKRRGQRWSARVLDLDIILWSAGAWASPTLAIPHPLFRKRTFVLTPLQAIAPAWRDPISGLAVRHLKARLDRKRALP
jgi:2-amino-4-hydroxy-6-hydroxymethyldihydropteridine diphosphokinase